MRRRNLILVAKLHPTAGRREGTQVSWVFSKCERDHDEPPRNPMRTADELKKRAREFLVSSIVFFEAQLLDKLNSRLNETSGGGNGDETDDGSRAESDGTPLPLETPIQDQPGDSSNGSGEVGNDASRNSSEVGGHGRSSVESEPTEPEEDGTELGRRGRGRR